MTQKTEFYNTFDSGIDLSKEIQKEIDNGWLVKFVINTPFETYHGGDIFKQQVAVTIIYEKRRIENETINRTI